MKTFLSGLAAFGAIVLWLLGFGIYIFTLYLAYSTSFISLLGTLIFPFFSQLFWVWAIWSATGVFFNLLTLLCLAWIALAGVVFGSIAMAES
jgi:hypothetical protein